MLTPELAKGAIWQLEVCNACRYCEGYCAVFPALERRRTVTLGDLDFLANLCHDCRACYYACMFTPPHEYGVNIPKTLSEVRRETYARYALPAVLTRLVASNGRLLGLVTVGFAAFFVAGIAATGDPGRLFAAHEGPGAFYQVIPYALMFAPAMLISVVVLALLIAGGVRFWRQTRGSLRDVFYPRAVLAAAGDALGLRYLWGGGAGGCTYPGERPSFARYVLHMLVFYGFVSALISTTIAFLYQDLFAWLPPYPLLSLPVLFGSAGGIAMIVGTTGLIYLKGRSDRAPADPRHVDMDYAFLVLLDVVNITGMLLLALRDTAAMGTLLVVHLATVFTLYFAIPYSKFAHFVYRYAALVQDRLEARRGA
jgi:citrate/tricarballylate utilization protein